MSTLKAGVLTQTIAEFEEAADALGDSVTSFLDSGAQEHAQEIRNGINECSSWLNKLRKLVPR